MSVGVASWPEFVILNPFILILQYLHFFLTSNGSYLKLILLCCLILCICCLIFVIMVYIYWACASKWKASALCTELAVFIIIQQFIYRNVEIISVEDSSSNHESSISHVFCLLVEAHITTSKCYDSWALWLWSAVLRHRARMLLSLSYYLSY